MKCAIELVFDKNSQKIINDLRKKLSENGVHDEAVSINHVSLADIEIEDNQLNVVKDLLSNFAKKHKRIKLILSSAGSFMSNENVLFLAPIMTEELIRYNYEIVDELENNGIPCGKYYTKNNWQPHCTVAIRLSDNELIKGFEVLKNNNILPLEVIVDSINLLCYNPKPYKELAKYSFIN